MPTTHSETYTPDPALVNSVAGRVTIPLLTSLITGLALSMGIGLIALAQQSPDALWVAVALFGIGFLLSWLGHVFLGHRALMVRRVDFAPESAEQPPVAPLPPREIVFTHQGQAEKPKAQAPDQMGRFLRDCASGTGNRKLRDMGWAELDISAYRDRAIAANRAAWVDDADHKRGWKLL
jgi:prepilin signal peptidase PulO-like enzyme (type II secretory pathway)